jgi:putative heme-binding domain-containing protein
MKRSRPTLAIIVLIFAIAQDHRLDRLTQSSVRAQDQSRPADPIPHGQDQAPNPPRSAAEAARAMTVPPGFHVEVVAAEPDIVNPVAMTFDEKGRIWVTESLEYPRRLPGPGRDRVKVLEDTDGDGRADRFTLFADGLNIPSGIAVGHGGVWVANAPDILFLQDRDGDGKADTREVVATGFGRSDTHELPNSLTWGPDGWLYGWNGVFNPCNVASKNGKSYQFTCAIFRIHPKTRVFEVWCEGTSNPWGIAIDPQGSFFSSACVIDHLWHLVETGYYIRQGGPYPPFTWPIESIVDHSHQKAAYCGIHYFDSPAYPPEYRGRLYMGNIHGNGINVDIAERNGSTYRAKPAPDFLQANDSWFMPVAQKTGPDGCLYVLDWYDRYHCYQDANRDPAGIDRLKGRLYRVRYQATPRRTGFNLAQKSDDELLDLLGAPNVYDREVAQRVLTERGSAAITAKLQALVLDDKKPRAARMHALWSRVGVGPLDSEFHGSLLSHADPVLRAWGVRSAGNMAKVAGTVRDKVISLTHDPSPDVLLQVAIAAKKIDGIDPLPTLLNVLQHSHKDPLIPQIVWQNLHPMLEQRQLEIADRFKRLEGSDPSFAPLAPHAIEKLLSSPKPDATVIAAFFNECLGGEQCREAIDVLTERFRGGNLPAAIAESLRRELIKVVREWYDVVHFPNQDDCSVLLAYCGDKRGLEDTRKLASRTRDAKDRRFRGQREELRLRAVNAILFSDLPQNAHTLVEKILAETDSSSSLEFRGNVLGVLVDRDDPELPHIVLKSYQGLEADLKPRAIEVLTERPSWSKPLLGAIEKKQIPASTLNITQLRRLQKIKDPEIAARVKTMFGTIRDRRNPQRERIVTQLKNQIRSTPGDPVAGQSVFGKLCAQCHKIYGVGQEVGPDITANGRNDFDQLVMNVFDPSLVIGPGYQATTVATTDGRVLTGLLTEDGADRIVLKIQGGKIETIPRPQVDELKTSDVSLMPEETEKQFSTQELADLFAFLCLDKPPSDPTAKPLPGAGPMRRR